MSIKNYKIDISDELLTDLKYRLIHTRWPNQYKNEKWEYGTEQNYLQSLISYWAEEYDWKKQEQKLNQYHHYLSSVNGSNIHFIHERGKGPHPIPIILTHGWPDSFLRYQKLLPYLTDPAKHGGNPNDSFDVIIPSLPGFGFSEKPSQAGMNNCVIAELWSKLMQDVLGYHKYAASGGDIGSGVTRYLACSHPDSLIGIHLTDIGIVKPLLANTSGNTLSAQERTYVNKSQEWLSREGAYMSLQSTKPQTLSYGLADSPVGLAAWMIEKYQSWSDCNGSLDNKFSKDELLTNIMIYWITNTMDSACRIYYENTHSLPDIKSIQVPTGISLFSKDIMPPPEDWTRRNLNVTYWNEVPHGGHFTAMEEPELFAKEIQTFFRPYRELS